MKIKKEEFLSLTGMEQETLDVWIEEEWLIPSGSSADLSFSDIDIARVRLIRELQVDFGVNDEAVGVILNLVDQLYGMRRTLRELRQAVQTMSVNRVET
jgi:chaperone modulatory protein CbpM